MVTSSHNVVVVGAGPAGVRAVETLVAAGVRPTVVDEAAKPGGQIFRSPPDELKRSARGVYGFEAARAIRVHGAFDRLVGQIDYRPGATVWNIGPKRLDVLIGGRSSTVPWDYLVLATGAMDRVIPFEGWTLPGVFTLGGAQIALKAQACSIGARPLFFGTGPLLYLVACQYVKAGVPVSAVLDTAPRGARLQAMPSLLLGGTALLKGAAYIAQLRARGVELVSGVRPVAAIAGADGGVSSFVWQDHHGDEHRTDCDALGFGYGLRSETQLAELCGLQFAFDPRQRQWLPVVDREGRGSVPGVYLAGDGARVRGAELAELTGEQAARALLVDMGQQEHVPRLRALGRKLRRAERFRRALDCTAFPFPVKLASSMRSDIVLCRCEGITAGEWRAAATTLGASEVNRGKAFSRVGMGRCQGRVCGHAAAEVMAAERGVPLEDVGWFRCQPPVKPIPLSILAKRAPP